MDAVVIACDGRADGDEVVALGLLFAAGDFVGGDGLEGGAPAFGLGDLVALLLPL